MSTPQENKKDNMRAESTTNKKGDYTHELTKWGLIILVIWLAYMFAHHLVPFFVKDWLPDIFRDNKGQFQIGTFGDYFGALNTLFAGLAFAGLIVTIRQQSADLQATKMEMKNQTKEFKKADIYRHLEHIKEMEQRMPLYGNNKVLLKWKKRLGISDSQNGHANLYIYMELCKSVCDIFVFGEEIKVSEETKMKILCIRNNYVWFLQWLTSLSLLFRYIETEFKDDPEEVNQLYEIIFTTMSIHERRALYLHKDIGIPDKTLKRLLSIKKMTPPKHPSVPIYDKDVRKLFYAIIRNKMTIEEAIERWKQIREARDEKKYIW